MVGQITLGVCHPRAYLPLARFFAGEGRVRVLYLRAKGPGIRDSLYIGIASHQSERDWARQTTQTRENDKAEDLLQVDDFFREFQIRHTSLLPDIRLRRRCGWGAALRLRRRTTRDRFQQDRFL